MTGVIAGMIGGMGTVPGAPTVGTATPGDGQISLTFTAPTSNGGSPITTYQYALSTDSYATWTNRSTGTTASPIVITGLSNGTPYSVKIRAVNTLGSGAASAASTSVTPFGIASAPTIGTITTSINSPGTVSTPAMTQDENNASFSWSSPGAAGSALSVPFTAAFDGGRSISDYEYSTDNGATFKSAGTITSPISITTVSASSTALVAGTAYTVKLRAVTIFGSGTASTGSATTTPTAVTSYTIKLYDNYPTDNELVETITGNTTGSYSRSHHKVERDWSVTVAAVNTNGTGTYSTESSAATGWRYSSYNADYARTRSCESGTGCDSCGTKTGTEDGTTARDCYQWTRSGSTTESGLACVYRTVPGGTEEQNTTWQGNCRDLEASCSDSWVETFIGYGCTYATGVGTGVSGYYSVNIFGSGNIRYSDSGCSNAVSCGGSYAAGSSSMTYCSTSGLWRANDAGCFDMSFGPLP